MMKDRDKVLGVNYDVNDRWEKGIEHHEKSAELFNRLMEIDFFYDDDFFCWKRGGDGDNGEELMYHLDIYFEEKDKLSWKCKGK